MRFVHHDVQGFQVAAQTNFEYHQRRLAPKSPNASIYYGMIPSHAALRHIVSHDNHGAIGTGAASPKYDTV